MSDTPYYKMKTYTYKVYMSEHELTGEFKQWVEITSAIINKADIDWRSFNFKGEGVQDTVKFESISADKKIVLHTGEVLQLPLHHDKITHAHPFTPYFRIDRAELGTANPIFTPIFTGVLEKEKEYDIKEKGYTWRKLQCKDFTDVFNYTFSKKIDEERRLYRPDITIQLYGTDENKEGIYIQSVNDIQNVVLPSGVIHGANKNAIMAYKLLYLLFKNADTTIALQNISFTDSTANTVSIYDNIYDGSDDSIIASDINKNIYKDFFETNILGSFILYDDEKVLDTIHQYMLLLGKFLHTLSNGSLTVADLFFSNHTSDIHPISDTIKFIVPKQRYSSIHIIYPQIKYALLRRFPISTNFRASTDEYTNRKWIPAAKKEDKRIRIEVDYTIYDDISKSITKSDLVDHGSVNGVSLSLYYHNTHATKSNDASKWRQTAPGMIDTLPPRDPGDRSPQSTYRNEYILDRYRSGTYKGTSRSYYENEIPNYIRGDVNDDPEENFQQVASQDARYAFQKREFIYTFDVVISNVYQDAPPRFLPDYDYILNSATQHSEAGATVVAPLLIKRYDDMMTLYKERDFIVRLYIMKDDKGEYFNIWAPRLTLPLAYNEQEDRDRFINPQLVVNNAVLSLSKYLHFRYKTYEPVLKENGEIDLEFSILAGRLKNENDYEVNASIPIFTLLGTQQQELLRLLIKNKIENDTKDAYNQKFVFEINKPFDISTPYVHNHEFSLHIDWSKTNSFGIDTNIFYLDSYVYTKKDREIDRLSIEYDTSESDRKKEIACTGLFLTERNTLPITKHTKYSKVFNEVYDIRSNIIGAGGVPQLKTRLQRAKDFHSVIFRQLYGEIIEVEFDSLEDLAIFAKDEKNPDNLLRVVHRIYVDRDEPGYYDIAKKVMVLPDSTTQKKVEHLVHIISKKLTISPGNTIIYKYKGYIISREEVEYYKRLLQHHISIEEVKPAIDQNYDTKEFRFLVNKVQDFSYLFQLNRIFNGDINEWDTRNVYTLEGMLLGARAFNKDISKWDTKKVINMERTFQGAVLFNQDLHLWDTKNVNTMKSMFNNAVAFNGRIADWNTKSVIDMSYMFWRCFAFNKYIGGWNTNKVHTFRNMFAHATAFNQPLDHWKTAKATILRGMFFGATSFNQSLNHFDTSNVTDMSFMFYDASAFNGRIGDWDVRNVKTMEDMFLAALRFNQDISKWNTESVTTMFRMFQDAVSFNSSMHDWRVHNVKDMTGMFYGALSFNQDISSWNVSNVLRMRRMFYGASSFNQNLYAWNPSSCIDFKDMFYDATAFNQPIHTWNNMIRQVKTLPKSERSYDYIFSGSGSSAYKDEWNPRVGVYTYEPTTIPELRAAIQTEINKGGNTANLNSIGTSLLTSLASAFSGIIGASTFNGRLDLWDVSNVTDFTIMFDVLRAFNQSINDWDMSSATTLDSMFWYCTSFNQPLDKWNVRNVTNMDRMFYGSSSFNQNINNWDVRNVTKMFGVFGDCTAFNQPLNNWNTSNVTVMRNMFQRSGFNQPLHYWDTSNVTDMSYMFFTATSFNQNIASWDISKVTNIDGIFANAYAFNQPVGKWTRWQTALKNNGVSRRFAKDLFGATAVTQANKDEWDKGVA